MPSQGYATEIGWDELGALDWATYPPLWSDDTPLTENVSFAMSFGMTAENNFQFEEDISFNQTFALASNSTQHFVVDESSFTTVMSMQSTPSLLWTKAEQINTTWTTIDYPN